MSTAPFSTTIKNGLNAVLRPVGLEVGTTLRKRIEDDRLRKLQDRAHWNHARYTEGLELDEQKALAFLRETCTPFRADYLQLPLNSNGDDTQFFLDNGWFGPLDAEILYSVLRRNDPATVFEVGSGFSTRLMRRAINDGRLRTKIVSIDPTPNTNISPYADEYIKAPVEDIEPEQIVERLNAGDVLFIDSSHIARTGGDVPFLFLEVIPRLKPGVFIHVHDIFIPFDYPSEWVLEGWQWNEQYLVHAFLAFNNSFEILWPGSYMFGRKRDHISELIPSAKAMAKPPSSLWFTRNRSEDYR